MQQLFKNATAEKIFFEEAERQMGMEIAGSSQNFSGT